MPPEHRVLGAVIAGGASRRFGSDKALALIDGRPMLDHVLAALRPQVGALVICGRNWPGEASLADLRLGSIGPLAGLEAALDHAVRRGFDGVLCVPVDTLPLPVDLLDRLQSEGAAVFEHQYSIGYWPIRFLEPLQSYLSAGRHDLAGWTYRSGARRVAEPYWIGNVNSPADLVDVQAVKLLNRPAKVAAEPYSSIGNSALRSARGPGSFKVAAEAASHLPAEPPPQQLSNEAPE
jgi:molybdenum cofactor guanylyltransferase